MVGILGELSMRSSKKIPSIPKNCTSFGLHLFRYAEYKEMSLEEVAKGVGIQLQTLRCYMNGTRYPKIDVYLALCEVLSDSREEYNMLLLRGIRSTVENALAERRLRRKEKQNNNNNQ
jgi:transcriptional regulator with XRE-family HTH domain